MESSIKLLPPMSWIVAALLILAVPAQAASPAEILVTESLAKGAPGAVEIAGGGFTGAGWQPAKEDDHLYYALPEGLLAGTVEVEVKGIRIGLPGDPRKHPLLIADRYLGPGARYTAETATTLVLRVWTKLRDASPAGKLRLRASGVRYEGAAREPKFQADSAPREWDPGHWYKLRIAWTQAETRFDLDDEPLLRVAHPDRQVPFRHVFLNAGRYGPDMHGLPGVVYRNLKITSPQADALAANAPPRLAEATLDDLKVLPDDDGGKTRLWRHLMGEARKQFARRRTAFEEAMLAPGAMAQRHSALRTAYRSNLGWMPGKTPLNPIVTRTLQRDGYRIENLAFESRPRHHVTANLYLPMPARGPVPAVLLLCGHSDEGKAAPTYQTLAVLLVKSGFVVLVPDPIAQGERLQFVRADGRPAVRGGTTSHTLLDGMGRLVGDRAGRVARASRCSCF
jgi:hypothetical protein